MVLTWRLLLILLCVALAPEARAERTTTRHALERFEEALRMGFDDGTLAREQWMPLLVVATTPAFEETKTWFPTAALEATVRVLGAGNMRVCEGCLAARTFSNGKSLEHGAPGAISLPEIAALDDALRGRSAPARAALWLEEIATGLSVRVLALPSGRILYAANVEPNLASQARSQRNFTASRDLMRRMRGESLTHAFIDVGIYPNQHLGFDWLEQWGARNEHLSGVCLSFVEPILGLGASYSKVFPELLSSTFGAKVLLSVPTASARAFTRESSTQVIDPLLTAIGILRIPIPLGDGNYGASLFVSSNGKVGIGLSTFNTSLIPVLP